MPEKNMEGLESEELLDELEVPTADYLVKHKDCPTCKGEDTSHYYKRRHVEIDGEYYEFLTEDQRKELYSEDNFVEKHELITREDHEEALVEAVQHGREQERRRILENLQTKLYQLDWIQILQEAIESRPSSWGYPDRNVETENGFDHPVIEWRNASDELISPIWNQLEEELEEEVEKNTSTRPKTGKSDNFGETE